MLRVARYASLLAVAVAVPIAARAQDSTSNSRDSALVLDHTFNAPIGEPVRVFLAKDVKYRVEIRGGSKVQLELRPLLGSVQRPLIEPLLSGSSAADETEYTVTPRVDAVYQFITNGGEAGVPVTLHVYAAHPPGQKS